MDADFTTLYHKYKTAIFTYLYYLSGDRNTAEDVCQDVFLKVYLNISKFDGRSSFKTWIYKIAKNAYFDFAKAQKRRPLENNIDLVKDLVAHDPAPEDYLLNQETKQLIQLTLSKLTERYRTLIILRDLQHLSYQEIGELTEQSLASVKVNIYRARKEFRSIYQRLEGN